MEQLTEHIFALWCGSALVGYLLGSVSFARILNYLVTGTRHIDKISSVVPGTDQVFESDSISATVTSQNLGKTYGCLTAILDMAKVAIPTFLVYYLIPEEPYYLLTGLCGVMGHNYPLYHKFKGGRGESPIIGAMLAINWFGIPIANAASMLLGYLTGSVLVSRYGWYVLMIFWYWIYFNSIYHIGFIIGANILFWLAMSKDLKRYADMKSENDLDVSEETVSEFLLMGKSFGRFLDTYGFPALMKKLFKRS